MILNLFDLHFPLFQVYDNDFKTKKIQIKLVWNNFHREFILTYNR